MPSDGQADAEVLPSLDAHRTLLTCVDRKVGDQALKTSYRCRPQHHQPAVAGQATSRSGASGLGQDLAEGDRGSGLRQGGFSPVAALQAFHALDNAVGLQAVLSWVQSKNLCDFTGCIAFGIAQLAAGAPDLESRTHDHVLLGWGSGGPVR